MIHKYQLPKTVAQKRRLSIILHHFQQNWNSGDRQLIVAKCKHSEVQSLNTAASPIISVKFFEVPVREVMYFVLLSAEEIKEIIDEKIYGLYFTIKSFYLTSNLIRRMWYIIE